MDKGFVILAGIAFSALVLLGAWSIVAAIGSDAACFANVVQGGKCVFPSGSMGAILFYTDALGMLTLALASISFLLAAFILIRKQLLGALDNALFFKTFYRIGCESVYRVYARVCRLAQNILLEWNNFHIHSPGYSV